MMEYVLFFVSGSHYLYYVVLLLFTDYGWTSQLYWPLGGTVFLVLGLILYRDSKRWHCSRKSMPLEVRGFISYTSGLYLVVMVLFTCLLAAAGWFCHDEPQDYLILVETKGVPDALTEADYVMLDTALEFVENGDPDGCKMVLAGYNLADKDADYTVEIQYLMQAYLEEKGLDRDRMIRRRISNSLRKNIRYSYAYVLVDWFQGEVEDYGRPRVAIMTDELSSLRYMIMIHNLGLDISVMNYSLSPVLWPARVMEELIDTLACHLINQFRY